MTYQERARILRASGIGSVVVTELEGPTELATLQCECTRETLQVIISHMTKICLMVNGYLTLNTFEHTENVHVGVMISSASKNTAE